MTELYIVQTLGYAHVVNQRRVYAAAVAAVQSTSACQLTSLLSLGWQQCRAAAPPHTSVGPTCLHCYFVCTPACCTYAAVAYLFAHMPWLMTWQCPSFALSLLLHITQLYGSSAHLLLATACRRRSPGVKPCISLAVDVSCSNHLRGSSPRQPWLWCTLVLPTKLYQIPV